MAGSGTAQGVPSPLCMSAFNFRKSSAALRNAVKAVEGSLQSQHLIVNCKNVIIVIERRHKDTWTLRNVFARQAGCSVFD